MVNLYPYIKSRSTMVCDHGKKSLDT